MKQQILFLCKYNRFRSKLAEAFFNKYYRGDKYRAESAGIIKGYPSSKYVVLAGKEKKAIVKIKTQPVSELLLSKTNILVIVANDVPKELFKGRVKKIIVWKIPDTHQSDLKRIKIIAKMIENKVIKFAGELK
ncbi:MAG: hypothetical protein WC533_02080 [Candidatus Pacearchaeota archaeon]